MIILGIDPGYAILGYGVLEAKPGQRPRPAPPAAPNRASRYTTPERTKSREEAAKAPSLFYWRFLLMLLPESPLEELGHFHNRDDGYRQQH